MCRGSGRRETVDSRSSGLNVKSQMPSSITALRPASFPPSSAGVGAGAVACAPFIMELVRLFIDSEYIRVEVDGRHDSL